MSSVSEAVRYCKEKGIVFPTLEQLRDPSKIPKKILDKLAETDPNAMTPINLFRVNWHNDQKTHMFSGVQHVVLPKELTGVDAKIIVLLGSTFPTGSHKVGATLASIMYKIVTGEFNPYNQYFVWPSSGNYCRGGAFNTCSMGIKSVSIMPKSVSIERTEWLKSVNCGCYYTPGKFGGIRELMESGDQIEKDDPNASVLNQWEDFTNSLFHYWVTGPAISELHKQYGNSNSEIALALAQGSGGSLASGAAVKKDFPGLKTVCVEALQSSTLRQNGFSPHKIEGIGDRSLPWILNVKNFDGIVGVDDQHCYKVMKLFNTEEGHQVLRNAGVSEDVIGHLKDFGISSIGNILGAIKTAKYFEYGPDDCVYTIATDSMALYGSRVAGMTEPFNPEVVFNCCLLNQATDNFTELTYYDKKRVHNLKYFTWCEQRGKPAAEVKEQWSSKQYWQEKLDQGITLDNLIREFNQKVGLE